MFYGCFVFRKQHVNIIPRRDCGGNALESNDRLQSVCKNSLSGKSFSYLIHLSTEVGQAPYLKNVSIEKPQVVTYV